MEVIRVAEEMGGLGGLQPASMPEQDRFPPSNRTLHHIQSSTSHSLARIFSLITKTTTTTAATRTSSSSCTWNPKFDPIDFKTSSIACPRVLNVLLGRSFSLTTGSPLNPPPCSLTTNGCTCHTTCSPRIHIVSVSPETSNNPSPSLLHGDNEDILAVQSNGDASVASKVVVGEGEDELSRGTPLLSNSVANPIGDSGDPSPNPSPQQLPSLQVLVSSPQNRASEENFPVQINGDASVASKMVVSEGEDELCGGTPLLSNSIAKSTRKSSANNPSETALLEPVCRVGVFSSLIKSSNDSEGAGREILDGCLEKTSHRISQLGFVAGTTAEEPSAAEPQATIEIFDISKNLENTANISRGEDHVILGGSDVLGLTETLPTTSEMTVTEENVKMLEERDMEEGEIPDECLDEEDTRIGWKLLGGDENEMGSPAIDNLCDTYRVGDLASQENCRGNNSKKKPVESKKAEVKQKNSKKRPVQDEKKKIKQNSKKRPVQDEKKKIKQSPEVMKDVMVRLDTGVVTQNISQEIAAQDQEMTSTHKSSKIPEKRKRTPLTKERKAKKKEAKKRKRAQMNRELGVKRLKLAPISKPKTVHNCVFYMQGRCQQGDKCKFSHDFIPSTKSQPCKYLIGERCLKGDDCPFDHDLSKYPCHNYQANGTCSRGDKCLFSHKLSLVEAVTEGALKVSKPDSQSLLDRTNIRKPVNAKDSTPNQSFPAKQQTSEVMLNPPAQAPEGICFLSFGKVPLLDDNRQQQEKKFDSYSGSALRFSEDDGRSPTSGFKKSHFYSSQTVGSGEDDGNKSHPSGGCKAILQTLAFAAKYESEVMAGRSFQLSGQADNNGSSAGMPNGGSKNASKVLQEFLFGVRG